MLSMKVPQSALFLILLKIAMTTAFSPALNPLLRGDSLKLMRWRSTQKPHVRQWRCSADAAGLKSKIMATTAPFGDPAMNVPKSVQDNVNELAKALESENPTAKPATADCAKLDGSWRVRYSNAVPPSNGQLGPFVGEPFQDVDIGAGTYKNRLSFWGGALQVVLSADWEVRDDTTWRVNFRTLGVEAWGNELPKISFPEGTARTWCMTYTDDDTRIVRAGLDGGRSLAREVGIYDKEGGQAKDAYIFFMTKE